MSLDFGKPFNGVLARFSIVVTIFVWALLMGYLIYLGFVHDRSITMWVVVFLILILVPTLIYYEIRKLWLYPEFRITSEVLFARDVGPIWKKTKYDLRSISNVQGHILPYVSFKHSGKKIFLYVPRMEKKERTRLVSELEQAANKALKCAPTAPDAAPLRRFT